MQPRRKFTDCQSMLLNITLIFPIYQRPLRRPKATIASESIVLARELTKEKVSLTLYRHLYLSTEYMLVSNIPDSTRSSCLLYTFAIVSQEIKQKKRFIMKKFQNVEGVALKILQSEQPRMGKKEGHDISNISEESKH